MKKNFRYYLAFLAFTIITLSNPVFPQQLIWNHLDGPMGGTIGDMGINSKGHIYAGVYTNVFTNQTYEGIYKSTDNGESWFKSENTVDQFEVYAVYINRSDHIFVGTNYRDRLYRSTDDGETWEIISNGYNTNECWAIGENKDGTVLFAGDGQFGGLYRSTNYGESWEFTANLPVLTFAVDSSNNIYCGTFIGLYKSTDNGLSWNLSGFTNIPVNTILADGKNGIYCGTGYYDNGQGVFYSTDYGNIWESKGLNDKAILSLAFTSDKTLLAGSLLDGMFSTTDTGNSWIQHNNGLFHKQVFRLKVNTNDDIFIGSEFEGVFRSTNMGGSFEQVGLPISGVYNIDFMGDSLIIAGTVSGVQKYNRLTNEWENIGQHAVLAVETDEDGNIYAATNGGGLFQSSNFGKTWINICQSPYILNVKKINNTILAATDTGLIRSTNNGNTWEETPVTSGIDNSAIEININGDIWVTGFNSLFKSSDYGVFFNIIPLNNVGPTINGLYVDLNTILIGNLINQVGIFISTDYGLKWINKKFNRSIWSLNSNRYYILSGNSKDILYSLDYGLSWDSISYPNNFYGVVTEIEFDSNEQLFFGTSSQGLYEMDFVVSVEDDFPIFNDFEVYPLYPNPFNSTVTVKYNLPSTAHIKIVVYNILCQKVKMLNLFREAGINEERISFDNLSGGIYLITVEGKDFFAVKKAAFIK